MVNNEDFQGVSNCYVFKSRLQEYAQKVGLPTPVYETIKDGPSHEPYFRSTVIVNGVRYDSLPGFFNRKAAEQSAAEVALAELAKSDEANRPVAQPVHETGLCKNLLQEYAQKMSYAMPNYNCRKEETPGRATGYSCTIEIGGILYIGGTAKTKREAELKAARTALLAIQSSPSHASENKLTVIPFRKREATVPLPDKTSNPPKPKKAQFKRRSSKRKHYKDKKARIRAEKVEAHAGVTDEPGTQEMKSEAFTSEAMKDTEIGMSVNYHEKETFAGEVSEAFTSEAMKNTEIGMSVNYHEKETFAGEVSIALNGQETLANGKSQEMHCKENNHETVAIEKSSVPNVGIPERNTEINKQQQDGEMVSEKTL